ncbi:MAG: hypothetical protein AAF621_02930 [Pseudomonadota bacterium]
MIEFLIVIDVILAIAIVAAVFFHTGPDGFMGEATPTNASTSGPRFETYDKIIGVMVIAFFAVTLWINYIHLYKEKGTARIDDIIEGRILDNKVKELQEKESQVGAEDNAPLAE